jgi:hypothetical protein
MRQHLGHIRKRVHFNRSQMIAAEKVGSREIAATAFTATMAASS